MTSADAFAAGETGTFLTTTSLPGEWWGKEIQSTKSLYAVPRSEHSLEEKK